MELEVWDLGGHLDFTRRAGAGTLPRRVKEATHGVAPVGLLALEEAFQDAVWGTAEEYGDAHLNRCRPLVR